MDIQSNGQPVVGLLYNPAVPFVIDEVGELVQYIEVIPERFWYDFGTNAQHGRFHLVHAAIETFRRYAEGRIIAGHGIGLSLPSAMPLDAALLDQVTDMAEDFGFSWYSEHMSMFLTPHASVPNAQAGLGLPVVYDEDTFEILRGKVRQLKDALRCPLMMENGSIFTPIPYVEMTEPAFFNRLYDELDCGMLLDLHNLYVSWRNGSASPEEYLKQVDPDAVLEVHMAGGDELAGFYTDSHSRLTPAEVWTWAREYVPRFTRLRAITFEFHESYFPRLGVEGIARELQQLHELAATCKTAKRASYA